MAKETITAEEFEESWRHFLECINFQKTNLDGEAIRFMNEGPQRIMNTLKQAKEKETKL